MPRTCSTLLGVLLALTGVRGPAQTADAPGAGSQPAPVAGEQPVFQRPQPLLEPLSAPPGESSDALAGQSLATDQPVTLDGSLATDRPVTLDGSLASTPVASLSDFWGYRYSSSSIDWIAGSGDEFGMVSLIWDHYTEVGIHHGLGVGMQFHFLAGPEQTDMPPRVFDFSIGYQIRDRLGPLAYDVSAAVMASSDFEGSAREGIRFPSHAVGFLDIHPTMALVFGIDYLDRGDIQLLPVGGVIWIPNPEMRFELVFPRPRLVFRLTDRYRLFLAGELGGDTWAIERETLVDDLATYRDLRVSIGLEHVDAEGGWSSFEIGYLFDRQLEYASGLGDMRLDDAVLFRLATTF